MHRWLVSVLVLGGCDGASHGLTRSDGAALVDAIAQPDGGGVSDGGATDAPGSDDAGPPRRRLLGRVTADGVARPGARVDILGTSLLSLTDDGGVFMLAEPPSRGRILLRFDADRDGHQELQTFFEFVGDATTGDIDLGTIALQRAGALRGQVRQGAGGPPAGTVVLIPGGPWLTTTAVDGRFDLPDVPAGQWTVAAVAPGGSALVQREVSVAEEETTTVDLALTSPPVAGAVSGRVTLADSVDATGVDVRILGTPLATTADAFGHYRFADVPAGAYTVIASHDGYRDAALPDVLVSSPEEVLPDLLLHRAAAGARPDIAIVSPSSDVLTERFTIEAEASTRLPVAAVEIVLDDITLVTHIREPFAVTVDPTMYPVGPHFIAVFAKDVAGNLATAQRAVEFRATCGNGVLQGAEECDQGPANADGAACTSSCMRARCGDHLVQVGIEECDQGGMNADAAACTSSCRAARCGDGLLRVGVEECDEGGMNADTAACTAACKRARCGDLFVQAGVEACDDPQRGPDTRCPTDCKDPWRPMTTTGQPALSSFPTSFTWTGSELLVLSPRSLSGTPEGIWRYTPSVDSWAFLAVQTPQGFGEAWTGTWTGTEWLVIGGLCGSPDARVCAGNPSAWSTFPYRYTANAQVTRGAEVPFLGTALVTAWTGSEMLVLQQTHTVDTTNLTAYGQRYQPLTDSWSAMPSFIIGSATIGVPFRAAWTGSELLACGPTICGAYSPSADAWRQLASPPLITYDITWTGSELLAQMSQSLADTAIVIGRFQPGSDRWSLAAPPPVALSRDGAAWTGSELLVIAVNATDSGAGYWPATNRWVSMLPSSNAPTGLRLTVWTGDELLMYGAPAPSGSNGARFHR